MRALQGEVPLVVRKKIDPDQEIRENQLK
ncbi:hypothetical protein RSK20926_15181 [Roseobacter sp. SK209-2-6]|nr:hypothetical protein RSK20926_15181 [Roseobacter sp. SK209-2-6]